MKKEVEPTTPESSVPIVKWISDLTIPASADKPQERPCRDVENRGNEDENETKMTENDK